jgi:hypothetical protein
MSETLRRVQTLVLAGDYLISDHGFDELAMDGILPGDAIAGLQRPLLSKITRIEFAARAFLPCSAMGMAVPSRSSGEFRPGSAAPRCS